MHSRDKIQLWQIVTTKMCFPLVSFSPESHLLSTQKNRGSTTIGHLFENSGITDDKSIMRG